MADQSVATLQEPRRTAHSTILVVAAIAILAAAVRFGFTTIPVGDHPDEPIIGALMERARDNEKGVISANWDGLAEWCPLPLLQVNPRRGIRLIGVISRPTYQFSPYTLGVEILAAASRTISGWPATRDAEVYFARYVSALLGGATVFLLFFAARRLFESTRVAIVAQLLLAFALLHAQDCSYARVESLLAFLITLSWFTAARGLNGTPSWRDLAATGFVCGLTIATKYNAVIVWLLPLALSLRRVLASPADRWRAVAWTFAISAIAGTAGFLAGTPEVLLRPGPLFESLVFESKHYSQGRIPYQAFDLWDCNLIYWTRYLGWLGFGWLPCAGALAFVAVSAWRGPERAQRRLLAIYLLAALPQYLLVKLRFERNLELMLSPLCLAAAVAVDDGLRWLRPRVSEGRFRIAEVGLLLLLVIQQALVLTRFAEALNFESSPFFVFNQMQVSRFELHSLVQFENPEPSAARMLVLCHYGDPFSEATFREWIAKHPGCTVAKLSSAWAAYGYPFSTIDVYHGPRYLLLVERPPQPEPPEE
jgi:4-amino-4-deoxy-L-arabinose transferase-like glycosyltransferase